MREHHAVIVIGGGLSGLYIAWQLQQRQVDVLVLEARTRTGGRILSAKPNGYDSAVDLGPAWIWPAFQQRMQRLVDELDISLFRQYVKGDLLYEMETGEIHRHSGPSAHHDSFRIAGGNATLIEALRSKLTESSIRTETRVTSIRQDGLEIETQYAHERRIYSADRIVLALPPRLMLDSVRLIPGPDDVIQHAWRDTPTWMASHSKLVYVYAQPFWREQGLSGEVFSRHGPLSEIYDGSPADESFYALTSFVGLGARQRQQQSESELNEACMNQLQRLFGAQCRDVQQVMVSDWSREPFTTTERDLNGVGQHPQYPDIMPRQLWDQCLLLAGTEVAREQGGYLEGALEAADEVIALMLF
jgi:monoamine oxidase